MGEKPKQPELPYFAPVDIPNAVAQALQYDVSGFSWSDQDFLSRFPGLVATRDQQNDDAYAQLTGKIDPATQQSFTRNAIEQGLSSTGGGNALAGLQQGSAGRNSATVSLANSLLGKQDQDRAYFDQLIGNNPQRALGLGGADIASLAALNTGTLNQANALQYQSQLSGIYAQGQYGSQTGAQIAALGSLLSRISSNG